MAETKNSATKPTPEEKLAAAEAEVDALVAKGQQALVEFEKLDQKQVDHIVAKASVAALNKHLVLAKMAVDETHRGLVEDKATKNIFACEHITNYLAGQKTVGIIREDDVLGIDEVAEPVGVVAGVTPVTNPTSTAIFKSLIALKTRCPIIFGFHPGAQNCSVAAAKIVRDAAIEAGAPENCIQWIEHPSIEATGALMKHDGIATILATGGPGMVKAAYSSGKPALGVGAGNAPAYVDKDVDIVRAANDLVLSKHFDYGMICATEQAIIAHKDVYAPLIKELKLRKAYFVNAEEKAKLEKYMFGCVAGSGEKPVLNSVVPGKSPQFIAKAAIIDYVEPEPSVETVEKGAEMMREEFEPDTIIAVGGGSPMDASKIMWLLYEHPEIAFSDVREKFFDIRKRAFKIPPLGKKAKLVCIPTSSGTGSEVTPFAVITDHKTGYKYPITDYALTPSVAIVDPVLARTQPRKLASDAGFDALTHSMEAYVSVYANDFTDGMALHAAKLIWDNLAESVNGEPGLAKTDAQEKMHNAATMAGMAFGSAFLGMCHGMAHTIGALCHIAHGRTNSILLPYVIRYNGQIPEEPTSWPKYNKYVAPERYQDIARNLGIDTGKTPAEAVENLAKAVEDYRDNKLGMNKSFQDCGVDEDYFWSVLDQIGMRAYEDQCTPANPRIPLINDMKDIAVGAYYGVSQEEGHKLRIEREGEAATEEASER